MAMQYDVKALSLANAQANVAYAGPARIKGVTVSYASGGTLVFKDGGSGGTEKFNFTAPAAAGTVHIIPGEGIRCESNVYANCVNATAVVFYG